MNLLIDHNLGFFQNYPISTFGCNPDGIIVPIRHISQSKLFSNAI